MILAILEAGLVRRRPAQMLMAPVAGEPLIWRMVQRARLARTLTKVVVAVSQDRADDALTGFLTQHGASVFRGNEADILGSLTHCVRTSGASHAAFVSADTPLLDPGLIDEAVRYALASRSDLVSSLNYPQGLAVQVAQDAAIMQVQASASPGQAHPYDLIAAQPQRFQVASFRARRDWSALDWRADTPEGFIRTREAFEALHAENPGFDHEDVLAHLDDLRRSGLQPDMRTA
jgi:spore coat polysaccharide biosynthesis protein SpsF